MKGMGGGEEVVEEEEGEEEGGEVVKEEVVEEGGEAEAAEPAELPGQRLVSRRLLLIGATYLVGSLSFIIILPLLTRNLTAAEYGIWVLVLAAVTLSPLIVDLGLPGAMVRFLAAESDREKVQEGFYSVLLICIGTASVTTVFLVLIAPFIAVGSLSGHEDIIRLTAAIIFIDCIMSVVYNYFRTFQRIKLYSGFITLQTLLLVALLAVTLLSDMGLYGAVVSLLVSHAIIMVAMLVLVVRELGIRRPDFSRVREFLGFGAPMIPGDLSDWALVSSDRYLIGLTLGVAFVGYYNPGYGLAVMILMMVNPLRFLLPSVLAVHFDAGNLDRVRSYLRASLKYFLLLAIPASVGLGMLSRDLLLVLTTPEIASEGYMVTPVLAVAMLLYGAQVILGQVLIVEKQTRKLGSVMAVTAGINIVLNLILLPRIGIMGAAYSTLVSFGFALVATGRLSSSYIHVDVDWVAVGKVFFATALMGIVLWLMVINDLQEGLVGIIGAILVGVGVYFGATLLLGTLSKMEYRFFWGLLRGEISIDVIGSEEGT